jgi:hypothetical protein
VQHAIWTLFERKNIKKKKQLLSITSKYTNLYQSDTSTLKELKYSIEFIIMPTDKNLGPGIMNHDTYIEQVFHEHLLTPTISQLSELIATQRINNTKQY